MEINKNHPINLKALAYLKERRGKHKEIPLFAPYEGQSFPYEGLGCHPDIARRIWEILAPALPEDGRCLVYGNPTLIHPKMGVLLSFALGMTYAIYIPPEDVKQAKIWSWKEEFPSRGTGKSLNTKAEFGHGWLFGNHLDDEIKWLNKMSAILDGESQ